MRDGSSIDVRPTVAAPPAEGHSDNTYVVGLDLGGTNIRLMVADSTGRPISRISRPIDMRSDPEQVVAATKGYIHSLFKQASLQISRLSMVGAGIPGITNVDTGVVKAAPFLSKWRNVPFRSMLEGQLSVPVCVENDVNLAAVGESHAGVAKGEKDFVFLAVGTGFGAGIMLRGRLYQGADWASGEVGYLLVCGACEAPLDHNQPGPLENLIGGPAIERVWRESAAGSGQPSELSATRIFELAETGVPLAVKILDQTASLLSNAIVNISLVLNCPLFVLGGGVGSSIPLKRAVAARLLLNNVVRPRLEPSALGYDAQLIGAIKFALDTLKSR